MRCNDIRELFSEYYEGEGTSSGEVSAHLQECPACALEYEAFARLINEVRELPQPTLPVGFHETLMRGVKIAARKRRLPVYMPMVAAAAASILVIAIWVSGVFEVGTDYWATPMAVSAPAPPMPPGAPAPQEMDIFEPMTDAAPMMGDIPVAAAGAQADDGLMLHDGIFDTYAFEVFDLETLEITEHRHPAIERQQERFADPNYEWPDWLLPMPVALDYIPDEFIQQPPSPWPMVLVALFMVSGIIGTIYLNIRNR